ncbi:PTS lactose/cellobiose transporter subunit IIA [Psychromonas ossibalaenae]|uniref:PTS lactose/cellobiose transporter subunit IIA n=1 Tax=Psychromonas ossibalaenae TaxID=444922 RepID=UPI00037DA581|nr:PTS lactose/cellobiose transporter subunit IIA [Psychromonas ossibalaenae]
MEQAVRKIHEDESSEQMQEICMELIVNAGDARSCAFEAIEAAKQKEFAQSDALLVDSRKAALEAHRSQTSLIHKEACGEGVDMTMTLVHAQDHLMTALLAKDLAGELVSIYQELSHLKEQLAELKGEK